MKAGILKSKASYFSGLLWAWGYLVYFAGPTGLTSASPSVWLGFSDAAYLAAMLVSYLLVVLFFRQSSDLALRRVSDCGCLFMTAGALVISLSAWLPFETFWITAVSSVAAGAGMALCGVAWSVPLSRIDMEALEKTVLGWFPVFAIVFLIIAASTIGITVANVVLGILLICLPFLSQVGFRLALRETKDYEKVENYSTQKDDFASIKKLFLKTLVYLLLVFGSLSFIWSIFITQKGLDFGLSMLMFSVGIILLLIISWVSLNKTKRFGLPTLYRWALPVAILALGLSLFETESLVALSYALFVAVYIGFDAMAKLFFIYIAQRHPSHAISIVGLGLTVINLGGMIGMAAWSLATPLMQTVGLAGTMLLALFPFVLSIVLSMGQDLFLLKTPNKAMRSETEATEVNPEENPVLIQCRCLGEEHGLTPRELEIISLLAQGRSRTYIRESLYISKGTVDTHAYHAYAKLGIKTKDDLMRLLLGD